MLVRRTNEAEEITANDGCRLRELLHPDRDESGLPYSLAVARVEPGRRTSPHCLTEESEVYFVVRGQGRMHVGEAESLLQAGDAVVIPAAAVQWIECIGEEPLEFLALVSPPWQADHDVRAE